MRDTFTLCEYYALQLKVIINKVQILTCEAYNIREVFATNYSNRAAKERVHSDNLKHLVIMATYCTRGIRLLLQILLLAIFLHFFGLPAIDKYQKRDAMVVETSKDTEGIPLPAISISDQLSHRLVSSCYPLNASITNCIKRETLNISRLLKNVLLGYTKKKQLVLGKP